MNAPSPGYSFCAAAREIESEPVDYWFGRLPILISKGFSMTVRRPLAFVLLLILLPGPFPPNPLPSLRSSATRISPSRPRSRRNFWPFPTPNWPARN